MMESESSTLSKYLVWTWLVDFDKHKSIESAISIRVLQISYSLVVILELSGISEIQYKEIMIIGNE